MSALFESLRRSSTFLSTSSGTTVKGPLILLEERELRLSSCVSHPISRWALICHFVGIECTERTTINGGGNLEFCIEAKLIEFQL